MELAFKNFVGYDVQNIVITSLLFLLVALLIKKITNRKYELVSVVLQNGDKSETNNNINGTNHRSKVFHLKKFSSIPGPWGYPLFGSAPRFGKFPHQVLAKWGKEYGPLFKMQIGSKSVIVITGYDHIRDTLVKQGNAFSGRGDFMSNAYICGGLSLTFSTYSPSWKIQKNKAIKALNIYTGTLNQEKRGVMESTAEKQATKLAEQLIAKKNIENSAKFIRYASANVICTICFGVEFEFNDPVLGHITETSQAFDDIMGTMNIVNFSPWMVKIPFVKKSFQNFVNYMNDFNVYINDLLSKSWGTYNEDNLRHVADCLRYESQHDVLNRDDESDEESYSSRKEESTAADNYGEMTKDFANVRKYEKEGWQDGMDENFKGFTMESKHEEERIFRCVMDIYGAGFETVAAALNWLVLYVTVYEDMQQKMADEIRQHLDSDETPSLRKHGDKLVYVNGFLHEFLRQSTMFPMPIPHCTTRDAQVAGYHIPKDTVVFFNFWETQQSKSMWEDPEEFRPERFMTKDPEKGFIMNVKQTKKLLTFGIGSRRCLGEQLAKNELFSFLVVLVRKCKFEPFIRNVNPKMPWPLKPALSIAPQPYKLKVTQRVYSDE